MKKKFTLVIQHEDHVGKVFEMAGEQFNIFEQPTPSNITRTVLQKALVPFMVTKTDKPLDFTDLSLDADAGFLDCTVIDFTCEDNFRVDIRALREHFKASDINLYLMELTEDVYELTWLNANRFYKLPSGGHKFCDMMRRGFSADGAPGSSTWFDILSGYRNNPNRIPDERKRWLIIDRLRPIIKRLLGTVYRSPRIIIRRKSSGQPTA